ncbi:MAG: hypothetical protein ABI220_03975 [Candidatus Saccharimonadales bacterium]
MEPKLTPDEPDKATKLTGLDNAQPASQETVDESLGSQDIPEATSLDPDEQTDIVEPKLSEADLAQEIPGSEATSIQSDADAVPEGGVTPTIPPVPVKSDHAKRHRPRLSRKWLIIVICVVLLLVAGGLAFALTHKRSTDTPPKNTALATKHKPAADSVVKPVTDNVVKTVTMGATYLDAAKKLPDQHLYSDLSGLGQVCPGSDDSSCRAIISSDIKYYLIGTTSDGRQIIVMVMPSVVPAEVVQVILSDGNNYKILAQQDSGSVEQIKGFGVAEFIKSSLVGYASNVSYDVATKLSLSTFPETANLNGQTFKHNTPYGYFLENGLSDIRGTFYGTSPDISNNLAKLGTVGDNTFYSLVAKDYDSFQVVEVYGTLNALWATHYDVQNELLDQSKPVTIKWKGGVNNKSTYYSAASGCGSSGYVVAKNVAASQLIVVGTSTGGQPLYQLSSGSALTQELYNKDYTESKSSLNDASLKNLTLQQFLDAHAYIIIKNKLGQYMVLQRDDMFMRGGCAKPVIYLYPQHKTEVSVQVGADVTVSNPKYPDGGWQNVKADTSGKLVYQGKQYDSLFWEGYGNGSYPEITNGTVVPSGQAVSTIRWQLKAQGLNSKEISDFLTYWQSKLPSTKYVRLTWLGTAQMNQLAPLSVNPAPKTTIRVFLDFEGLQHPEKLPAQHFVTPIRRGFTLVEWGGLARHGLDS